MTVIDIIKATLNAFEIAAFAASLMCWKKIKHSAYKWFPFYLGFIVAAEFTGKYLTYRSDTGAKMIMYDYIVIPAEFLFFIWIYYTEFKKQGKQKIALSAALLYLLSLPADIFIITQKKFLLLSFSYTIGTFMLLILALYFLYRLVTGDDLLSYKTNLMFWISAGLLAFYVGSIPFFGMMNTIYAAQNKSLFYGLAYTMYGVDIIMYLLFTLGFIWYKPK